MTFKRNVVIEQKPTGLWEMRESGLSQGNFEGQIVTKDKSYNEICDDFNTYVKTCEKFNLDYTVSFQPIGNQ